MNIQRATPVNELLAKLIFLIVPTILVSYFLLYNANQYYTILQNQALQQTIYLAAGMGISALLYSFRFRFPLTFGLLLFGLYVVYKGLDKYAIGEFDTFFISVQFQVFAVLFLAGWLTGWGFVRLRYFSVFISAALLSSCILLIAKANVTTVYTLMRAFSPALLFTIYIIFTAEQIYSYKDKSQRFWWFLTRRLVAFAILAALLLGGVYYIMQKEIKETVANYGGSGKQGNGMLHQNKDGRFDLNDETQLRGSMGRTNELLFCAHIDHFFPGTQVPNPLYLTAFYYTKFDTLTETFERDPNIPSNDLFLPDVSKIPLFVTKTDSTVIKNSMADKLREVVEVQIYNVKLSNNTYLAPNVGYFVQPVTVEKDFRGEFTSAFRAKSYVSLLNSAYFVYNAIDPSIKKFQEQRFNVLRNVTDYKGMDAKFMKYYTYMPSDVKFKEIADLSHKVTDKAITPVDKVIAIRDYFLSKDENGDPLYKYTDNPGVPDIPSASKLRYFLFENHKGYCAYYAGATLFMLRALGIPSRIAVGFLTMDRSDAKNKGWYWYYANQAHAWVQVYFPGYGWLDFDTTVGNSDAQESPKPDGTPPSQPPKAWLAADGIIQELDTARKTMVLKVKHMVFQDKEYNLPAPIDVNMDLKIAAIRRDSIDVPLATIEKGEEATAVSYAEAFKKMIPGDNESGTSLIKRFPNPAPIDEVYLKIKDVAKPPEQKIVAQAEKSVPLSHILWITGGIFGALILLMLSLPYTIYLYFKSRYNSAKNDGAKAYWGYRTATYYLHQAGIYRGLATPMQYARQVIDPRFGTSLSVFMNAYLKNKYAKQELTSQEKETVHHFLSPFLKTVRAQIKPGKRFAGFINPIRTVSFFVMPEEEKEM